MQMTRKMANYAVREGIRRTLDRATLPKQEYDEKTIKILLKDLKESLADEVPQQSDRLDFLGISIRRRCRKKGWRVIIPPNNWYTDAENQDKMVSSIADYILLKPMDQVR